MKKMKENKRVKALFFFGFYLIFFLLLAMLIKNTSNKDIKEQVSEKTTIKDLYNNNFTYSFLIDDNDNVITFNGTKDNIDYNDYEYKYFLNYINVNQLIKKSKIINRSDDITYYEIDNSTLNDLLNTKYDDGINKIEEIYGNSEYQVVLDLSSYMESKFIITLNYKVGD